MKFNITYTYNIDIEDCKLNSVLAAFNKMKSDLLNLFMQTVLEEFANQYMSQEIKPFACEKCKNNKNFIWKTRHGKLTKIITILQVVFLRQFQVECKDCGHKFYITRYLLGLEKRKRISIETIKKFGLIGALTTFRVAEKITKMFGVVIDKMTIWRSVQKTGKDIEFDIDPDEEDKGEADGTGVPIVGIKKRGQEMKVFVQHKKGGGVRIAGLTIGKYDQGWDKLFKPLIPNLKKFKKFLLITDGDDSILKSIKNIVQIKFQRCLWHIPHQLKFVLWKDKVSRKSDEWLYALGEILNICTIKSVQDDDREDIVEKMIISKEKQLDVLIEYCHKKKWKNCAVYLQNAKPDMFTGIRNRLNGKTTSHAERVMKTINHRINVGKWSPEGALNVNKIRLAYYYNGFDVE
jgi:hypothetical protein